MVTGKVAKFPSLKQGTTPLAAMEEVKMPRTVTTEVGVIGILLLPKLILPPDTLREMGTWTLN